MGGHDYERLIQLALSGDASVRATLAREAERRGDVWGQAVVLATGEPEAEAWGALCFLLEPAADDGAALDDSQLDALERALAAWPPLLLMAPMPWFRAVLKGAPPPCWRLCRSVPLDTEEFDLDEAFERALTPNIVGLEWAFEEGLMERFLEHTNALPGLTALSVCPDDHEAGFLKALRWPNLTDLDLSYSETSILSALARATHLSRLERLSLTDIETNPQAMGLLASIQHWPALREINLARCHISSKGGMALAKAPWLGTLESLVLDRSDLGVRALKILLKTPMPALRHLGLASANVNRTVLPALLEQPANLEGLRSFDLQYSAIGEVELDILARCEHLTALRRLNLSNNLSGEPPDPTPLLGSEHLSDALLISLEEGAWIRKGDLRLAQAITELATREALGEASPDATISALEGFTAHVTARAEALHTERLKQTHLETFQREMRARFEEDEALVEGRPRRDFHRLVKSARVASYETLTEADADGWGGFNAGASLGGQELSLEHTFHDYRGVSEGSITWSSEAGDRELLEYSHDIYVSRFDEDAMDALLSALDVELPAPMVAFMIAVLLVGGLHNDFAEIIDAGDEYHFEDEDEDEDEDDDDDW